MRMVFVLVAIVATIGLVSSSCDTINLNGCSCSYPRERRYEIYCQSRGLTKMPPTRNISLSSEFILGNFSYNSITTIDEYYFAFMKHYDILDFTSNRITTMSEFTLKGLEHKLQTLNLSKNRISSLPRNTFTDLTRLENLDLSGNSLYEPCGWNTAYAKRLSLAQNRIESLSNNCFQNSEIEDLNLADNQLSNVASGAFNGMDKLRKLNLDGNNIANSEDPFRALNHKKKFTTLSLQNNELRSLQLVRQYQWPDIMELNLGYNILTEIVPYCFMNYSRFPVTNLLELNLEHNQISGLTKYALEGLGKRLTTLRLNNNRIKYVDVFALTAQEKLGELNLDFNQLDSLAFLETWTTNRLRKLSASHNNIRELSADLFTNMKRLDTLTLDSNLLVNIDSRAFTGMSSLLELSLNYNLLTNIADRAFEGINLLRKLRLNGNSLVTLKNCSFSNLVNLVELHFTDNLMHCDCDLQWLLVFVNDINKRGIVDEAISVPVLEDSCHSPSSKEGSTLANAVVSATCMPQHMTTDCFGAAVTVSDPLHNEVNVTWAWSTDALDVRNVKVTQLDVDTGYFMYNEQGNAGNQPITLKGFTDGFVYKICVNVTLNDGRKQKDCAIWPEMIKKPTTTTQAVTQTMTTETGMHAGSKAAIALTIILIILIILIVLVAVYLWRTEKYKHLLPTRSSPNRMESNGESPDSPLPQNGGGQFKTDPLDFRPSGSAEEAPMMGKEDQN